MQSGLPKVCAHECPIGNCSFPSLNRIHYPHQESICLSLAQSRNISSPLPHSLTWCKYLGPSSLFCSLFAHLKSHSAGYKGREKVFCCCCCCWVTLWFKVTVKRDWVDSFITKVVFGFALCLQNPSLHQASERSHLAHLEKAVWRLPEGGCPRTPSGSHINMHPHAHTPAIMETPYMHT